MYIRADGRIYTKSTLVVDGDASVGGALGVVGDADVRGDAYLKGKTYIEGHKSYVNPDGGSGVIPLPDYIRACVNNEY